MSKATPFLMFNDQLESAIEFYTSTFPDSRVKNVARTGKDGPINAGEFVIGGQSFMGYNGGPYFTFSEGFSLFVECEDQEEVGDYWNKLVKAGADAGRWADEKRRSYESHHVRNYRARSALSWDGVMCDGLDEACDA